MCRKASVALIRKMVHYGSETVLTDVALMSAFGSELMEVIANVLEKEVSMGRTDSYKCSYHDRQV